MRLPPLLSAGARVALVAPAGPLRGAEELDAAIANARSLGWEPRPGANVLGRHDYLGGTDAERLRDLNAALADDDVDAVWCVRGGYGAMRLLPHIDWASLTRRPRALLGFSDVTALHCRGEHPVRADHLPRPHRTRHALGLLARLPRPRRRRGT